MEVIAVAVISIHAPAWGATSRLSPHSAARHISIHAPAWGATNRPNLSELGILISIHAPAWGATRLLKSTPLAVCDFNPRARVGRDMSSSTYASRPFVFQSTRPRGARLPPLLFFVATMLFQSTRPRGARQSRMTQAPKQLFISIHAPAWGATFLLSISRTSITYFNPRARVGRDASSSIRPSLSFHFNPRARVGRDGRTGNQNTGRDNFNPRARVGRDPFRKFRSATRLNFNPRARVGRDDAWQSVHPELHDFNPRARVGRDGDLQIYAPLRVTFQSTRPRGARQGGGSLNDTKQAFQSTRPRGARPSICLLQPSSFLISIHAPAWGATPAECRPRDQTSYFNPRACYADKCDAQNARNTGFGEPPVRRT